jgi:Domain of unknown function (DUF1905)/Bacteriocin-protection, YdeI or OmpD-Associated
VSSPMAAPSRRFRSKVGSAQHGDLFIEVPFDVRAVFGRVRVPVYATVNGYRFRSRLSVYGEQFLLPMRKGHRDAAGIEVGDAVSVLLELDEDERVVELPRELAALLRSSARLRARWDKLSFTHRREHAESIASAKRPETRARRLEALKRALEAPRR